MATKVVHPSPVVTPPQGVECCAGLVPRNPQGAASVTIHAGLPVFRNRTATAKNCCEIFQNVNRRGNYVFAGVPYDTISAPKSRDTHMSIIRKGMVSITLPTDDFSKILVGDRIKLGGIQRIKVAGTEIMMPTVETSNNDSFFATVYKRYPASKTLDILLEPKKSMRLGSSSIPTVQSSYRTANPPLLFGSAASEALGGYGASERASEGFSRASERASEGFSRASERASEGFSRASERASERAQEVPREFTKENLSDVFGGQRQEQRFDEKTEEEINEKQAEIMNILVQKVTKVNKNNQTLDKVYDVYGEMLYQFGDDSVLDLDGKIRELRDVINNASGAYKEANVYHTDSLNKTEEKLEQLKSILTMMKYTGFMSGGFESIIQKFNASFRNIKNTLQFLTNNPPEDQSGIDTGLIKTYETNAATLRDYFVNGYRYTAPTEEALKILPALSTLRTLLLKQSDDITRGFNIINNAVNTEDRLKRLDRLFEIFSRDETVMHLLFTFGLNFANGQQVYAKQIVLLTNESRRLAASDTSTSYVDKSIIEGPSLLNDERNTELAISSGNKVPASAPPISQEDVESLDLQEEVSSPALAKDVNAEAFNLEDRPSLDLQEEVSLSAPAKDVIEETFSNSEERSSLDLQEEVSLSAPTKDVIEETFSNSEERSSLDLQEEVSSAAQAEDPILQELKKRSSLDTGSGLGIPNPKSNDDAKSYFNKLSKWKKEMYVFLNNIQNVRISAEDRRDQFTNALTTVYNQTKGFADQQNTVVAELFADATFNDLTKVLNYNADSLASTTVEDSDKKSAAKSYLTILRGFVLLKALYMGYDSNYTFMQQDPEEKQIIKNMKTTVASIIKKDYRTQSGGTQSLRVVEFFKNSPSQNSILTKPTSSALDVIKRTADTLKTGDFFEVGKDDNTKNFFSGFFNELILQNLNTIRLNIAKNDEKNFINYRLKAQHVAIAKKRFNAYLSSQGEFDNDGDAMEGIVTMGGNRKKRPSPPPKTSSGPVLDMSGTTPAAKKPRRERKTKNNAN